MSPAPLCKEGQGGELEKQEKAYDQELFQNSTEKYVEA